MRHDSIIAAFFAALLVASLGRANATGTVVIKHSDGTTKTYHNVRIAVRYESMAITSADGKGMVVLGKASCEKVGGLLRCLTYDATLLQAGQTTHIPLRDGTVWLNPSATDAQQLTHSSTKLPPHGVLLAVQTKRGTYVTMTGVVDEILK
jgi:hypothetical protein